MDRPTIFISSTIFDFRDLRSALKDYLEARGCDVNASEFNDFDKPLDEHSYKACLKAIERSDFFVLLIGSRIGGWFDDKAKISITRQEYRHAYALAKAGKLKILTFVRDDVWNHRQSTKELRRALKADDTLSNEKRAAIANHSTAFATDAETIIAFVDEVSKNQETAAAARGEGPLPVANWIHTFKSFADIRQALDLLILNGQSVDVAARKKALQVQLLSMLREVVPLIGKEPMFPAPTVLRFARELNLNAGNLTGPVTLNSTLWSQFAMLAVIAGKPRPEIDHIRHILTSDLLLRYNPAETRFEATKEYDLLADVAAMAANLGRGENKSAAELLKHGQAINQAGYRRVPAALLAAHLHRMFRLGDLVSSARALVLALEGLPFELPARMPRTPFLDQEEGVAAEEISLDQIRAWVGLNVTPAPTADPPPKADAPRKKSSVRKKGSNPSKAKPRRV